MDKQIILTGTTPRELAELINEGLKTQIEQLKNNHTEPDSDELLTRVETYEFLKIDSSTLWAWTKKGKVKSYGIGNRVYYKRSELLECLIAIKQV